MKVDEKTGLLIMTCETPRCIKCNKSLTETLGNICPMCSHIIEHHKNKSPIEQESK